MALTRLTFSGCTSHGLARCQATARETQKIMADMALGRCETAYGPSTSTCIEPIGEFAYKARLMLDIRNSRSCGQ
jgi:hypothetical protein